MTARGKGRAGKGKGARRPAPRARERGDEAAAASPPPAPPTPPAFSPDSPVARFLARFAAGRRDLVLAGLAALSGAMWFLSCADWDIWPMAWVAILPCLVAIEGASTVRRAVLFGWLSGLVANVGGFYWVTGMLVRFGHLPRPVALLGLFLLCGYQGVSFALFAAAVRHVRARSAARSGRPLPMALLAPIAIVAFEMLVPFLFPWYLAITQAWVTPVIQIAELTGPVGVSAMLVAVGGGLYDLLAGAGARRRVLPLAGAALFAGAAVVFGLVRIGQVDEARAAAPSIEVGVVQGNISFDEKGLNHQQLAPGQLRGLQKVSSELAAKGADLILWSESSYPYAIRRDRTGDFPEGDRRRIRGDFAPPVVVGALTTTGGTDPLAYNSAVYVGRDGSFAGRFDKIFLLMFGEYVPFRDLLGPLVPKSAAQFERGEKVVTFPFEHGGTTYRLGPMICYEDIIPQLGRELAALHPHLLINLTNDAWYGDTSEPWEHLALSVFRAVEARTDLVRSVNTGVSAFIDASGRVMSRSYAVDPHVTPTPMTGHLDKVALVEGGHTFYARFGDLFGWTLTAAALLLWIGWPLATRLRNRRSGAGSLGA
ncbi:MAG TPA: apolipoprotein N-acyltransferase [Kofleriaceae bacterium]|nr:apolipoprotein N-acyltransferase [Kofleriaceae bacterium]